MNNGIRMLKKRVPNNNTPHFHPPVLPFRAGFQCLSMEPSLVSTPSSDGCIAGNNVAVMVEIDGNGIYRERGMIKVNDEIFSSIFSDFCLGTQPYMVMRLHY